MKIQSIYEYKKEFKPMSYIGYVRHDTLFSDSKVSNIRKSLLKYFKSHPKIQWINDTDLNCILIYRFDDWCYNLYVMPDDKENELFYNLKWK